MKEFELDETWGMQVRLVSWYLGGVIVAGVLVNILIAFIGGGSSGATVATMLVAMLPGDVYYRRTGTLPSAGFSWRMAIWFTLASNALGVVTLLASIRMSNAALPGNELWLAVAFVAAIMIVPTRFLFSWGAKSKMRAAAKLVASQAPAPTEQAIELERLQRLLASLEAIPAHRRSAEGVDERAAEVRALMDSLLRS